MSTLIIHNPHPFIFPNKTPQKPAFPKTLLKPIRNLSSLTNTLNPTIKIKSLHENFSQILENCKTQISLPIGKQIHTHILKRKNTHDSVFLTTKLILMYGKCGSFLDAQKLFDEMPERTIFTYNAMLGAYVLNGEDRRAIELYKGMRVSGVFVDGYTCSVVLKACAAVKDLRFGKEIHGYVVKFGLDCNSVVLNSLVGVYLRCGDLRGAELLFDGGKGSGDVVLWNLMISGYCEVGMSEEGLRVFVGMLNGGVVPSTYSFVAALQVCEEVVYGKQIHAVVLKCGVCFDRYVGNALLVMYSKCSRIEEAARVFVNMGEKDSISWNSMLAAYVHNGLYDESVEFFRGILSSGQKPDQVSVISVLSACGRSKNLLNGMEIHAFGLKNGMDLDLQVGNTIIDMYAKCFKTSYMESAFRRIPEKDSISWSTIITGYVQNNCYVKALLSFSEVLEKGIDIDNMMIESVLLACRELKCISIAKEIHGYIMRRQLSDTMLLNTFVDLYGECGEVDYAGKIFGLIELKSVVSWTSMIACYVHNGLANEALQLSLQMVKEGVELDSIALLSILSAAANISALMKGKEIHGYLLRKFLNIEEATLSSLVDMYATCGAVDNSFKVFNCVERKDLILYTSMINAYGMHGQGREAVDLFVKMEAENIVPDHIAFLACLHACSHSALVDEGKRFFDIMTHKYNLEPWPEHYACLVDLLGRANYLEEAFELVKSMQVEPTAAIWCALIGACRTHSNMDIGEIAARKLLEIEPDNPGNYVLVSNLYAAAERWEDVEEVRMRMKEKGLKKDPGCSWIEVGDKVHTFITRDKSHPQCDEIYENLSKITEKLEKDGAYKAETRYVLHNLDEEEKVKMLHGHSERLAIAYGLLSTSRGMPIRVTKNLRVCGDCHTFTKLVSEVFDREIIVRDANRFHHFRDGVCSCGDFW